MILALAIQLLTLSSGHYTIALLLALVLGIISVLLSYGVYKSGTFFIKVISVTISLPLMFIVFDTVGRVT